MKAILILLLLFPGLINCQSDNKILFYNVGFGGVSAGIGAVINRKNENWKTAFLSGFWQGSVGGLVNFTSKEAMSLVETKKSLGFALPARILNCAGNSIILNAANRQPFLSDWFFEYTFLRIDFSTKGNTTKVRLLPESLIASGIAAGKGKFDLSTTLQTGVMSFKSENHFLISGRRSNGINYGRAFIYMDSAIKYHLVAHEVIHEFQYREYLVMNSYFNKTIQNLKMPNVKKIFTNTLFPDFPYFGIFYMIQGQYSSREYLKNYYEFEAEKLSRN